MTAIRRAAALATATVLLASALPAPGAGAAPAPKLDPSFGAGGRARPVYGPTFSGASFPVGAVGADGSLVVNRQDSADGEGFVTVERYTADGRLDPTFKTEEKSELVEAEDAQGRTLRTSRAESPETIERLDADGSLDKEFGCDAPIEGCHSFTGFSIAAILPLPSGKILVAGSIAGRRESYPVIKELALARFDESGALDPGFGKGGIVHLAADDGVAGEELVGLTLGGGEDALVSLNDEVADESSSWLPTGGSKVAAVGPSGQLDPAFGAAGVYASADHIGAIESIAGGGLLLTGERFTTELEPLLAGRASDIYLTRLTPAGAPDPTFGEAAGTTVVDLGGIDHAGAILRRPDGSIVVGGATTVPHLRCIYPREVTCDETPVLVGFTAAGTVAPDFGEGGTLRLGRLRFASAAVSATGVLFLHDLPGGGIVAGGGTQADGFLAEVEADGRFIPAFGEGGIVAVTHPRRSFERPQAIATDAEGRLVVLGETDSGTAGTTVPAVFRLRPSGQIDRGFGDGRGFVTFPGHIDALALDPRGRALVLTGKYSPNGVTRVTRSGRLDPTFGTEGVAALPEAVEGIVRGKRKRLSVTPRTVLGLPGGGVLVGAVSGGGESARLDLIRLTPSGSLDRGFGDDGMRPLAFPGVGVPKVRTMALTAGGRIVIGGSVRATGPGGRERQTAAVFRLTAGGRPDPSFGTGGLVTMRLRGQGLISALALGPHGEIVAAGHHFMGKNYGALLVKLSASGHPDRAFDRRAAATEFAPDRLIDPGQVLLWHGGKALASLYARSVELISEDGRLEREVRFGKGRHPRTWIAGATLQHGRLVVASKTSRLGPFTLTRLLPSR
jgi:uncharacterized delta-60 repeat protein